MGYLLAFALIAASALAQSDPKHREAFAAASGLVPTMILSLLLIAAQAVTAVTRERDLCSLDLLLATDLTPHEFIFGKLGGIAFNSWVYLLLPLFLTIYYAVQGMLAAPVPGGIDVSQNVQALICVIGTQVVLAAFTMVLGLHVGLRIEDSRTAVVHVLGAVFFLTAGTLLCIGLIVVSGRFEYQWGSFVIFLGAGIGGLWWVLNGEWSSPALILASWLCPLGLLYAVMNVLIGKPGTDEASSPWLPFLAIVIPFGFAIRAMLTPLLSEFDLALGRTHRGS
jgi:ABC-type Na+ efflux pump permease subunit